MGGIADPQAETEAYIEEHGLKQLFQDLTAHLIFYKPDDPYDEIAKFLTSAKEMGPELLFNTKDLETMFGMFDVTRKGTITMKQAREALRTILGPDAQFPSSVEADDTKLLRVNEFVEKMSTALKAALPPTRGR